MQDSGPRGRSIGFHLYRHGCLLPLFELEEGLKFSREQRRLGVIRGARDELQSSEVPVRDISERGDIGRLVRLSAASGSGSTVYVAGITKAGEQGSGSGCRSASRFGEYAKPRTDMLVKERCRTEGDGNNSSSGSRHAGGREKRERESSGKARGTGSGPFSGFVVSGVGIWDGVPCGRVRPWILTIRSKAGQVRL
jgi:hypothetical protein